MRPKYFASLDGLRGVAILMVVFYHYFPHRGMGFFGYLCSGMWIGVDLFFVLSGFLITGILFDTQHTAGFYKTFYIRRALRLLPLYLIFVTVILLLARGPGGYSWPFTLSYLLYGSNIMRFLKPGAFEVGRVPTAHLWSLAVEEQFYFIWPFVVGLLSRRRRILIVSIIGSICALVLRIILAHFYKGDLRFIHMQLPTRADALLTGAILAMLYRDESFMSKLRQGQYLTAVRCTAILALIGFAALALHTHSFFFGDPPINTWGFSLTAIAAGMILLLALQESTWTNRFLQSPFLRFYGRYSYGLYLIHYTFIDLYREKLVPAAAKIIHPVQVAEILAFLLLLALSTFAAILSFHFIEMPFLKMKNLFEYRRPPLIEKAP